MDWDEAREVTRRVMEMVEEDRKTQIEVAVELTKAIVNVIARKPTL